MREKETEARFLLVLFDSDLLTVANVNISVVFVLVKPFGYDERKAWQHINNRVLECFLAVIERILYRFFFLGFYEHL